MKKVNFCILSLFAFLFLACGSGFEGQPSGVAKVMQRHYVESGALAEEIPYNANGKIHGIKRTWYENGNLKTEDGYKDGKLDGVEKGYFEDGQLRYEGAYKDGKQDGIYKSYDENGQLRDERAYKDGKVDGVLKRYENEQLQYEVTYKNGKRISHLKSYTYYNDGSLWEERTCDQNFIDGSCLWDVISYKKYKKGEKFIISSTQKVLLQGRYE